MASMALWDGIKAHFWIFLSPLALFGNYGVVFSKVMPVLRVGTGFLAMSYVLYLTSGLLPWMAFFDFLTRGSQRLLEASP
jgi:ABC-type polysaccharide/polyol phosphate export permease